MTRSTSLSLTTRSASLCSPLSAGGMSSSGRCVSLVVILLVVSRLPEHARTVYTCMSTQACAPTRVTRDNTRGQPDANAQVQRALAACARTDACVVGGGAALLIVVGVILLDDALRHLLELLEATTACADPDEV